MKTEVVCFIGGIGGIGGVSGIGGVGILVLFSSVETTGIGGVSVVVVPAPPTSAETIAE